MRGIRALLIGILLSLANILLPIRTSAEQGLQITNPIIEIQAEAGKTYTAKISLLNVTTADLVYSTTANDFRAKDEAGTAEVLLNGYLPASSSMAKWIQPIGTIAIKAKQTKQIEIRVVVPKDAEPGGHYGIIRFTGSAPEIDDNGVALIGSTGPLILVRVSGDIKEALDINEFFAVKGNKRKSMFETGPIGFVERIKNTGNVHLKPVGDLTVTNMFGKNVSSLKINESKSNVLPDSIRKFDQTMNNKWLFGRYTASMSVAYGTKGQVLLASTSFWVIPYKLLLIVLLFFVAIIYIIRLLIRRYNDKIIKRALNENKKQNK